jgi:hypothetical protein
MTVVSISLLGEVNGHISNLVYMHRQPSSKPKTARDGFSRLRSK